MGGTCIIRDTEIGVKFFLSSEVTLCYLVTLPAIMHVHSLVDTIRDLKKCAESSVGSLTTDHREVEGGVCPNLI